MDRELEKMPGVVWNFSQPISDNVEEAVSGVKGELAVKLYGDDLKTLEEKGDQIVGVMSKIPGVADLGLFRVIGQPNLNYTVDREAAARYGINVADVQDAIETAVGGNAGAPVTQVLDGEARYDVVVRYLPLPHTPEAIEQHPPALALRRARLARAAHQRQDRRRRRRDLSRRRPALRRHQVQRARPRPRQHRRRGHRKVNKQVKLPTGYTSTGPASTRARSAARAA
jgi:cobalt-zinc-cadmium resistance protein CzcA